ncbi:LOW QUALITY PROTEIN: mucin-5AC [Diaphorina citri]|uniref:LOW QUALITY PROTEIN: mucin-5AC n=1 Tax=Diaphorina citri TaxID=121845 RepID=A0A3Q0J3E7_DIACI|nr:LOW QUALITY PROTEIN: mucin-5AC [Diaphorina citri]
MLHLQIASVTGGKSQADDSSGWQQEFFFSNAAQRAQFLQQQQQQLQAAPSPQPQQFSNFFQPINSGPFSPFRPQDISSSSQPQFQSFQQTFPSQPTAFQLPPLQSSVPTNNQNFNFITSSRASPPAPQTFQPIKPQTSFQPSSNFRQQKQQQQQPFSSVPTATRGDSRFQFTPFSSGETQPQPPRPTFQNNVPVSSFQSPQAFSEVFHDDTPKQQFNGFVNNEQHKDNIDDFIPQSRWRNTKANTEVDTNRLQRKPQPAPRAPSPPQARIPNFPSDEENDSNDSNSLGQPNSDYDKSPTFFKQPQTQTIKQNSFTRNGPVVEPKKENLSPKTRFEISTYRPQHQFIPRESIEDENEEEEELENGEDEEEYIDEPVKPSEPVRTTQAVRPDSRYRPTTYSPPSFSKARFINNQSNRQNSNRQELSQSNRENIGNKQESLLTSEPEVTTFRQKPLKNIATNTINKESSRTNSTVIPITLKNKFKITGPIGAVKNNSTFDVVVMNKDHSFVAEDNFKGFVDSASIDVTDVPHVAAGEPNASDEESGGLQVAVEPSSTTRKTLATSTTPSPSFSTVTATSVSNKPVTSTTHRQKTKSGGLQVAVEPSSTTRKTLATSTTPSPSFSTVTATSVSNKPVTSTTHRQKTPTSVSPPNNAENPTSTESWVIVASVQTSRSVSGARFIPSGAVKQEEQPKPLAPKSKESESEDELEKTTLSRNSSSTESIIDKLDRVQSELSSGILTGGFNPSKTDDKFDLDLPEKMTSETVTTTTTTTPEPTSSEEPSSTSKFVPSSKRFTTSKPSSKPTGKTSLKDSIQFEEDLVGLLPAGYKQRTFTKKSTTTTTTTSTSAPSSEAPETTTPKPSTTTRSLIPKLKPKFNNKTPAPTSAPEKSDSSSAKPVLESILNKITKKSTTTTTTTSTSAPSSEAPETTTPKPSTTTRSLIPKLKPKFNNKTPGSTSAPEKSDSSSAKPVLESILNKIKFEEPEDISKFLPPGFKPEDATEGTTKKTFTKPSAKPVDIGKLKNIKFEEPADISKFLPPGFKPTEEPKTEETVKKTSISSVNESPDSSTASNEDVSSTASPPSKVVFPSKPGSSPATRKNGTTSAKSPSKGGTLIVQPKIQIATTEFMGWPSPPTSTISIEELLRAAKASATSTESAEGAAASSTSTTTTTTTTTPAPTTPGYCTTDCELAATIKLVGGAKWVPELLDHNTKEWQTLANEVEQQLDTIYSSSSSLNRWYKKIRIDAFSPGSVLVDYFVELSELGRTVSTADMKRLFHESLLQSTVNSEALTSQPASQQSDYSKLKLGTFDVDPKFTDFVVLKKPQVPVVGMAEQDSLLPQWAIAVIVIGLASLLFVLIFGITVLVSRHKHSKKQPSPLTEDMLHELNKNHMGGGHDNYGAEDLYNMEDVWNDKPVKKRGSTAYQDSSMPNLYDSWRSDWNGYYYNAYYGAGGGGGSNHSAGYATRRRSDYDTNF